MIPIAALPIALLLWPMTAEVWPALPAAARLWLQRAQYSLASHRTPCLLDAF